MYTIVSMGSDRESGVYVLFDWSAIRQGEAFTIATPYSLIFEAGDISTSIYTLYTIVVF